ncbi:Xaa-Pro dipeptidyl-peptidase [Ligilactobacillus salitolerans]|uniref:Xaa-Pro dipeptidyl-peptidase n=1 Tax=Ligilactobacillus salitolerans TaxID=1808352 RepID=A0A401ISE8_9LACO|nr:Xaa-Pro dipeptidyl-peptidase [Ligilactobacillus salitolerans]GBG94451.1 Xaa-Pro dipeptidyl-peptidase [Ligilactobacillus salitolerans]
MQINQYANIYTPHAQIVQELTAIRFLTAQMQEISEPAKLYHALLLKFFLEKKQSQTVRLQKMADLMATQTLNAVEYTTSQSEVSQTVFHNIALQLLGFQAGLDFEIDQPEKALDALKISTMAQSEQLSSSQLLDAWYRLLNTHTKFGQTLIDELAGKGYYAQFADDPQLPRPLFFNGKAQAVFDTSRLIREVVYVEASLDSDHDGQRDLLKAEIIRPAETVTGLKVPTIFTASPYEQGTNDQAADNLTHDVNQPLQHKQPNDLSAADIKAENIGPKLPAPREVKGTATVGEETFAKHWTYKLNDYFLARGFAVVYSAGVGTKDSDGLRTTGTRDETLSATAVIEWLHGTRKAFTNRTSQIAIKAWWCNGNVGMTGRSYLGTLSTAAALSGVAGLKTAVVEAGLSSYYDYYRENGLVVAPGGFQGEDADVLAELTFSREQSAADHARIKETWENHLASLTAGQDRKNGDYNTFWDARNLLNNVNIKCDLLLVHGLNDWNVKLSQVWNLRERLKQEPITQKLILHQGQHEYLNNFRSIDYTDQVNLWLSNKLYGVQNHANDALQEVLVQDNSAEETWHSYLDWGDGPVKHYRLNDRLLTNINGNKSFSDHLEPDLFQAYLADTSKWQQALLTREHSAMDQHAIQLVFTPLKKDLVVDGRPQLTLRTSSSLDVGMLSAALVDYGKAKRLTATPQILARQKILTGYNWQKDDLKEFTFEKQVSPYKKFTDAHVNMQNRENAYRVNELKPGEFYNLTLDFQPTFWRLLAGHQLGLVIYATDMDYTIRGNQEITYTIDLAKSSLSLPVLAAEDDFAD